MKTLYDIFRIKKVEKIEIDYLIEQCFKLGIEDEVQESLFQFSPSLVQEEIPGFGEHEPWSVFFMRTLIHEILFFCIEETIEGGISQENLINEVIWNDEHVDFVLKNDFRNKNKEEILELFKAYLEV